VRDLATDKESGIACVLRGARELICWNIAAPDALSWTLEAPKDAVSVFLPDDASMAFLNGFAGCFLKTDGSAWCPTLPAPGAFDCQQVIVMDQPASHVCSLCAGKVRCGGFAEQEVPEGAVDEIAGVDGELFWRKGQLLFRGSGGDPATLAGVSVKLDVFHDGTPCVLGDDGTVRCANTSDFETDFVTLSVASSPFVCGLDSLGRASCINFENGQRTRMSVSTSAELSATLGGVCVRSPAGEVACYNDLGEPRTLPAGL
jgi:hypothetical protein